MSFTPQYNKWGQEDFLDPIGSIAENPGEYNIVTGVVTLRPIVFSGASFAFNAPWDPVSFWNFENSLDSPLIITGTPNLTIVNWTGYQSPNATVFGNTGDQNQTAFFANVVPPVLYNGEFVSGSVGGIVWNPDTIPNSIYSTSTTQFSVRVLRDTVTHSLSTYPSSGVSCQGFFYAGTTREAFVEVHPDGLKIHGITGAIIPGDYSSRMRTVRFVRIGNRFIIMTDDGQSYESTEALKTVPTIASRYMFWGAPPTLTGATFAGANGVFHPMTGWFDPQGQTGICGFEGTTLWDDLKVSLGEGVITYPNGYGITWPTGTKTLYTAPWYPNNSTSHYIGAVLDTHPIQGGTVTVTPQYAIYSGNNFEEQWLNAPGNLHLAIDGSKGPNQYIDLSSVPVFYGISNALRFKLEASSTGGPVTQIDKITVIGDAPSSLVDVTPNWKLSSLPKNIFFSINKDGYDSYIPPAHYQDEIYLHNETGQANASTGTYLASPSPHLSSGLVSSDFGGPGLSLIKDGFYGNAWRNLGNYTGLTGNPMLSTYSTISTGIFIGDLLDNFSIYPNIADLLVTATGSASVHYRVEDGYDLNNNSIKTQTVTVDGYTGSSTGVLGLQVTGLNFPPSSNTVATIQGIIHIPAGPGVNVILSGNSNSSAYYLDGHLYRDPRPFSVACPYSTDPIHTLVIGAKPRASTPTLLSDDWGVWKDELNAHNVSQFKILSLTGFASRHSYLSYVATGNFNRTEQLDETTPAIYSRVHRESALFEGWVRPLGIISDLSSEAELFSTVGTDSRGLTIFINRDGHVRAAVALSAHASVLGETGDHYHYVGFRNNNTVYTGEEGFVSVTSDLNSIAWGNWNHIGLYQDTRFIGDTYDCFDQPVIANRTGIHHGVRSSRLYLELNGRIVGNIDISLNGYASNYFPVGSVDTDYPSQDTYVNSWPKATSYSITGNRQIYIGRYVAADFDHLRFGVRNTIDTKALSTTMGTKEISPTFTPWDAIKVAMPSTGSIEQYQYAHIYRFDHDTSYLGWDDGFAPNHALMYNYQSMAADFTTRDIKSSHLLVKKELGPKGRSALRIGPGQNVVVPWCSFDERIYNGTGSMSLAQSNSVSNSGSLPFYTDVGTWVIPNMGSAATGIYEFHKTSADNKMILGGFWNIHKLPSSSGLIGDLVVAEEVGYNLAGYGSASLYLGLNSDRRLVYGTRKGLSDDGYSSEFILGPFTGSGTIPLESWTHIGIESNLNLGEGYFKTYVSGQLDSQVALYLSTGGGLHPQSGRPFGYQGLLGGALGNQINRNSFYIGGQHLKDANLLNSYMYFDVGVSEFFIGYPLSGYAWPWSRFAQTGVYITGWTDYALKNNDTRIAPLIGTGYGVNAFYNGVTAYPATSYTGAGKHLLWITSNNGNDFEGIRKFGIPLYDDSPFNNAESYYAIYENDTVTKTFGSIDSPIQLGVSVPPEGVNLALVSNKEWTTESSISTFDLSDSNYANITNKVQGDFTLTGMVIVPSTGVICTGQIDSADVRVSSFSVWDIDSSDPSVGYFMHLIGSEDKGVYIASSPDHTDMTGDYLTFHNNLDKIQKSIVLKDVDGNRIPYDEFPYYIVVSPYSPNTDMALVSGSINGYGPRFNSSIANQNKVFTCILVAAKQSIGKTVFINYPSAEYFDTTINIQDSEIYNPVPLFKQVSYNTTYGANGNIVAPTGSFSLSLDNSFKDYNITIYGANLTGWAL